MSQVTAIYRNDSDAARAQANALVVWLETVYDAGMPQEHHTLGAQNLARWWPAAVNAQVEHGATVVEYPRAARAVGQDEG